MYEEGVDLRKIVEKVLTENDSVEKELTEIAVKQASSKILVEQ